MSKKGQKILASAAVMSLVMSTVAMAAPTTGAPVSGTNRVDTSVAIAKQAYSKWTDSKVAVIANGEDAHLVDALTVAPLAYQKQAPIFLTYGTSTLEDSIINELKAQGVTTVYVVGGTVTTAVDAQLKAAGVQTVTHLAGATRFDTANAINAELEKGGAPAGYAVVNTNTSVADALSIAAEAAKNDIEIVLATDANSVPVDLTGKSNVYAIGGNGVLSDALVTKLNATRLGGANRFATNAAVLQQFGSSLDYTTTYVADGTDAHLVDSLPGSVLAAQTSSPIVLVSDSVDPSVASVLTGETSKMTTVTPLGGAVNPTAVSEVVDPSSVGTTTPTGALAVSSVKATAANTITVQFNQTPADTSKVTFTVQKDGTPITLTPTWNGSEATLTYSSNLPMGNYTVDVKNDTTDLGTSNLTVDQEKVASIEITTDKFATSSDGKSGFFTYKVLDQYGNDITNSSLASIQWTVPGVTDVQDSTGEKGVITATVDNNSNFNFLNLQTLSITAIDSSDNIVVTKTLTVSPSVGTLSDFKLLDLTNPNNEPLQAGDTSAIWYADYQAKDLSGNLTDNFTLLKNGLVSQNSNDDADTITLSTSGYITAQIKNEDGKGVIEVKTTSSDPLTADVPVTITAITKNGTSSTLNLTLKKKAQVDKIVLYPPTEDIAYGDSEEIPFAAYDQDGNQLTKFDDIVDPTLTTVGSTQHYLTSKYNDITLSPVYDGTSGFYWLKKGDDTAELMYKAADNPTATSDTTATLTASTNSGKFSSITINIRKPAQASTLSVATDSINTRLTPGAYIRAKHQYFTVKDQYGRAMDLSTPADIANKVVGSVYVNASIISNSNNALQITGNTTTAGATQIDSDNDIFFNADPNVTGGGTATVKFALMQLVNGTDANGNPAVVPQEVSSQTVDFTVEKMSDIEGIKIDPSMATSTLYNIYKVDPSDTAVTYGNNNYVDKFNIWGVDSYGNTVVLPATQTFTTGASNDYLTHITQTANNTAGMGYINAADYNEIQLGADYDVDPGSTVVTVSAPINGDIKSTSATIKTSEDSPVAQVVSGPDQIDVKAYKTTATLDDVVTITDQYGEDMLDRKDGSVQVWLNGNQITDNSQVEIPLSTLHSGDRITVVANNGQSLTMTVK